MTEKIHCDLLEVYGPNWGSLPPEKVACISDAINSLEVLLGDEPRLYGFVGTRRMGNIVGGYFAIQYSDDEFHYKKNKQLNIVQSTPFARIFFVFFAETGKVLLQNTKFAGISLTMPMAIDYFRKSIDYILAKCEVRQTFNLALAPEGVTNEEFITEFERSTRVVRLVISNPSVSMIPDDFVYYNPQKERNAIIRGSHQHDYDHLKRIDLEASESGDIKKTHLRDLMYVSRPQFMKYFIDMDEYVIRRAARRKFEIHVDMESEQISEEQLVLVIEMLRRERAIYLDTPTPEPDRMSGTEQLDLFSTFEDSDDDNEEENDRTD